jgi:hypothetical protein
VARAAPARCAGRRRPRAGASRRCAAARAARGRVRPARRRAGGGRACGRARVEPAARAARAAAPGRWPPSPTAGGPRTSQASTARRRPPYGHAALAGPCRARGRPGARSSTSSTSRPAQLADADAGGVEQLEDRAVPQVLGAGPLDLVDEPRRLSARRTSGSGSCPFGVASRTPGSAASSPLRCAQAVNTRALDLAAPASCGPRRWSAGEPARTGAQRGRARHLGDAASGGVVEQRGHVTGVGADRGGANGRARAPGAPRRPRPPPTARSAAAGRARSRLHGVTWPGPGQAAALPRPARPTCRGRAARAGRSTGQEPRRTHDRPRAERAASSLGVAAAALGALLLVGAARRRHDRPRLVRPDVVGHALGRGARLPRLGCTDGAYEGSAWTRARAPRLLDLLRAARRRSSSPTRTSPVSSGTATVTTCCPAGARAGRRRGR